jgi:zinc and cadmium transporter
MSFQSLIFGTLLCFCVSMMANYLVTWQLKIVNERVLALSAGIFLAVACLHLLPESHHLGLDIHALFSTLLIGVMGSFILEKVSLFRHNHHYDGDSDECCEHVLPHLDHSKTWLIGIGDGMHNLVDGLLIATAFMTESHLGWLMVLSVVVHELPQELGNVMTLKNAGLSIKQVRLFTFFSSSMIFLGALFGVVLQVFFKNYAGHLLVLSASNLLYVAISDLIPYLHSRSHDQEKIGYGQIIAMFIGIVIILIATKLMVHQH